MILTKTSSWSTVLLIISCMLAVVAAANNRPNVMLATIYRDDIDVTKYWVSEKLDGVRARWDGARLISRGGHTFATPDWFIEDFPQIELDGELWIGRGRYEETMSVVRKQQPHSGWESVKLMVFDLPAHTGTFDQRVHEMQKLIAGSSSPFLDMIEQFKVSSHADLKQRLQQLVDDNGEGLMLHRGTALYHSGRSDDLLKYKLFDDAEARVIGYRPGTGKYQNMTGSLKVRDNQGNEFHIGSGLTDAQRRNPPAIGDLITFKYQGLTRNGIPRFPIFLRIRYAMPE